MGSRLAVVATVLAALAPPTVAQAVLVRANPSPVLTGPVAWEPNTGEAYSVVPGSTTIWRFDDGWWVPTTSTNPAPTLAAPVACTWPNHGVLMVGSGQSWVFDGSGWTPVAIAPAATVRAIAYDHARNVFVAVADGTPNAAQTWEFDGVTWTQRLPALSPPTLPSMHMAWEPSLQRCLLRIANPPSVSGHFTWNGTGWIDHGFIGYAAVGFGMSTAPGQAGVLLSGGFTFPINFGGTFLWGANGTAPLPLNGAPPVRRNCVAWFDATRNRTVVTNVLAGERGTWYWDGTAWSRAGRGGQVPQGVGALAYDSWRGRLLAFGGAPIWGIELVELWQMRGGESASLGTGPSARFHHSTAFDSRRGRLVVCGGARWDAGGGHYLPLSDSSVHEWDGATWHAIPVTWPTLDGPMRRVGAGMAFDRTRGTTVMFGGGVFPPGSYYEVDSADTFEWDGSTFTQHHPATTPPATSNARLVFDPELGQCVLCSSLLGGTAWAWDGTNWHVHPISPVPGAANYDEARGRWIAFGYNTTWERIGGTWLQMPFAGIDGPTVFDLAQGAFAGSDGLGDFTYGDPAAATLRPFGEGCAGSAGVPVLHGEDAPRLGRTVTLHLARAPAAAPFVGMFGIESTTWLGLPLPIGLAALGAPACVLHTAIDAHELRTNTTSWPIVIPNSITLLGNRYRAQAFVFDASANPLGATTSNGIALRVGS